MVLTRRPIRWKRSASQALSGWNMTRALTLLNLVNSDWAIHQGASASLPPGSEKHVPQLVKRHLGTAERRIGRHPGWTLCPVHEARRPDGGAVSPCVGCVSHCPGVLPGLEPLSGGDHGGQGGAALEMASSLSPRLPNPRGRTTDGWLNPSRRPWRLRWNS